MEPSGAERDGGKRRKEGEENWQRHYALKVAQGKVFMLKMPKS